MIAVPVLEARSGKPGVVIVQESDIAVYVRDWTLNEAHAIEQLAY